MPQNVCTAIEALYADQGTITGTATLAPTDDTNPTGPQTLSIAMPLNTDAEPDVLFLELWGDSAPFQQGFVPVTQSLGGDQSDLVLCGACTYIAADYVEGGLIDFNMAYSGELVIDAVDPTPGTGSIQGSLTGVKLHEVTVSEAGQMVVAGGCKSEIEAVAFDFSIAATAP